MHAESTHYWRQLPSRAHITEERWVKAHIVDEIVKLRKQPEQQQAYIQGLSDEAKLDALANLEADLAAKEALAQDPANLRDQPLFDLHHHVYIKTLCIARVIATLLPLWPSNEERGIKHDRKPRQQPLPRFPDTPVPGMVFVVSISICRCLRLLYGIRHGKCS